MNQEELHKIKKEFTNKLSEIEKIHKQQIESERNILLSSWRWRIGNFQVNLILWIKDFFVKIYRIISGAKYKIRSIKKLPDNADGKLKDNKVSQVPLNPDQPVLACIFDTFTYSCFQPEFNIIKPHPDNWRYILNNHSTQALFCESAWAGNDAAWRFFIGNIGDIKKNGLVNMVDAFRQQGLPAIFWNKEDPVHFDHFIDDARHFDYIFTSDEAIIPRYIEIAGHNRVFALPFAAQEKIHNPILTEERNRAVCFAGTWYNTRYAERILDMHNLLKPAMDFGLEIYDRNFGARRYEKVIYGFPELYQPFIKGKLAYNDMVQAYKRYKVFLNVNSVRYSPTMFSRRVFELLASGTPVISNYSDGIVNLLGDDIVLFADSEEDTRQHLTNLLSNERMWWSYSLKGIRTVLENHTYRHRTKEIFEKTGLPAVELKSFEFLLISHVENTEDVHYLSKIINNQSYSNIKVLLFSGHPEKISPVLNECFKPNTFELTENSLDKILQALRKNEGIDYMAFLNSNDFYGRHYIRDLALAFKYAEAGIIGKRSCFQPDASGQIKMKEKGWEYRFTSELQPGTLAIKASRLDAVMLSKLLTGEGLQHDASPHFSTDPWNYIAKGRFLHPNQQQACEL